MASSKIQACNQVRHKKSNRHLPDVITNERVTNASYVQFV